MAIDFRRVGIWMVVAGGAATSIGVVADAVENANDPARASREGILDLSSFSHALFVGGIAIAVLGLIALVCGASLYASGKAVSVGRRLAQVAVPILAIWFVLGGATVASNSSFAEPTVPASDDAHSATDSDTHAETDATAASGGAAHDGAAHDGAAHDETGGHEASSVPPKPYDPSQPIDLSGVAGVTPEQQARAENLIAITLKYLPKYADYKVAEANGYRSIGDAITGDEHFINLQTFDDGRILDPLYPESLVYKPDKAAPGGKRLAAAMYMLEPDKTLDEVPDVGGKLTQWHIHNNLCFTPEGKVAGITSNNGPCRPGLNTGTQAPMLHVWIEPHPCGPFAALEGVGAGQIKEGETKLCDEAHGSH